MARRIGRLALLAAGLGAIWGLWYWFYFSFGWEILFCPVHKLTGLYCPGCGTMRAISALLRLDLEAAAHCNALFLLLLPFLALGLVAWGYRYVRYGAGLPLRKSDKAVAVLVSVLAVAFTVARNLPAGSFLAP